MSGVSFNALREFVWASKRVTQPSHRRSRVLKAVFASVRRVYQQAQESRPYWFSSSTVSGSRAVEGVSQDESRLPPPPQPAHLPPGYPHKLLKTRKNTRKPVDRRPSPDTNPRSSTRLVNRAG